MKTRNRAYPNDRFIRITYPAIYVPDIYVPKGTSTPVENVRQINLFMQNKPKVKSAKINVNSFVTSIYELHGQLVIQTNKPKQTQFKPKQTQFKANLSKGQN
jgi:hypothetical protein